MPLRILQVSPAFEPRIGGVEAAVREATKRLTSRGHAVEVLTTDETHLLPGSEQLHGAEVTRVRAWPKGGDQRIAPGILRELSSSPCDVVHIQSYQTFVAPLAMIAAARAGIPYVVTFHGGGHSSRSRNAIRGLQLQVLRPLLARARALIATAEWEVPYYSSRLRLPPEQFVVIPNGCNLPAPSARPSVDVPPNTIVAVGRAERYKGHQFAIRALPRVIAEVPDARLWIAGEGPYVGELAALADSLGIRDRVDIHAVKDRADYAAQVQASALAVLFSEFETHPLAVIEAAALGVPLLVADKPGLSELIEHGTATGIALEAGTDAHARAIVRLLKDPPPPIDVPLPTWENATIALEALYRRSAAATRPRRAGAVPTSV